MNFLVIQADQQRRDSLLQYGNTIVETPNLDRLVARGTVFENAFTPSPICAPARASLITGKRPIRHGITVNPESGAAAGRDFNGDHASVAQFLNAAGYRSTLCGKWHVGSDTPPSACGFDGVFHPGYGYPAKHPDYLAYLKAMGLTFSLQNESRSGGHNTGTLLSATQDGGREASVPHYLVNQAIDAIRTARQEGTPFFVRVDFWGPHIPYIIPEPYASMYSPDDLEPWPNFHDALADKPAVQNAMKHYWGVDTFTWDNWAALLAKCYGYIRLIDDEVGRLLDVLNEEEITDNTAVFYTSDHGGMVGAHGLCDKGPHLYDEQMRIPLIAAVPGMQQGARANTVVYNMDIMPTLLELAGLPIPDDLDAISLIPALRESSASLRDSVAIAEFHGHQAPVSMRMVRTKTRKYIFNASDTDELYDLQTDPGELVNRISDPAYAADLADLRATLLTYIDKVKDPIKRFFVGTRL